MQKYGWSAGEVSFAYTLHIVALAFTPLLCSKLRAALRMSRYCFIGAAVYGFGIVMCSFIQGSVYELYIYFGILAGLGSGMLYLSMATYVVQLFPEKRGMAAGLYTACYGCGAFFWAPLASFIIGKTGTVDSAFLYMGGCFLVGCLLGSVFLHEIPAGYQGEGGKSGAPAKTVVSVTNLTTSEMLKNPMYYLIVFAYICGSVGGMMVLSLGSPIVQGSLGYSPEKAAFIVGLFAIASTGGRLFWGVMSDKLGRTNILMLLGLICTGAMVVLSTITVELVFLIALLCVPMCYGAYAAILSPINVETFGTKTTSMNFNMLFLSFGISAAIGPPIVSFVRSSSGGFHGAFYYGIAFGSAAVVLSILYKITFLKKKAALIATSGK
jgi:OFA family oxalate/formate antiporter-like MFS transporter